MVKLFILILFMNDGTFNSQVHVVDRCPTQEMTEAQYDLLKVQGLYKDWLAFCNEYELDNYEPPRMPPSS